MHTKDSSHLAIASAESHQANGNNFRIPRKQRGFAEQITTSGKPNIKVSKINSSAGIKPND